MAPPLLREYVSGQAQNHDYAWLGKPSAGEVLNLARYGQLKSWLNPEGITMLRPQSDILRLTAPRDNNLQADVGFEWPEFRTVQEVIIGLQAGQSGIAELFLEYWDGLTALQGAWKGLEQGLTNGCHVDLQGQRITYRFEQRRTCKMRLRSTRARQTEITEFAVHGPSVWKAGDISIEWGHGQEGPWNGELESYNGEVTGISATGISAMGSTTLDGKSRWKSGRGQKAGIAVSLLYASGMDVDRTILTIRSPGGDCSFLPREAVEDEPIDIVDYGVYVRNKV